MAQARLVPYFCKSKQQGVAQRRAERARATHGNRLFSGKTYLKVLGAERSLVIEPLVKRAKRHVEGVLWKLVKRDGQEDLATPCLDAEPPMKSDYVRRISAEHTEPSPVAALALCARYKVVQATDGSDGVWMDGFQGTRHMF